MQAVKFASAWGMVFVVFVAASLSAAEQPPPAKEPLRKSAPATVALVEDERLQRAVSLEQRYCTLGDALEALSRETRVKLQAEAPLTDENVLLLIKERPVGELLDLLAAQFGYYWAPVRRGKEKGYELRQLRPAREREAKLRDQELRTAFTDLMQELAEQRRLLDVPFDTVRVRRSEVRKELERKDLPPAERATLEVEEKRIDNFLFSPLQPMSKLLLGLKPEQRQRLLDGQRVLFSAAGEPQMEPLPAATARAIADEHVDKVVEWYRTHPPRDVRAEVLMRYLPGRQMLLRCRSQMFGPSPPGYTTGPGVPLYISGKPPVDEIVSRPGPSEQEDPRLNEQLLVTLPRKAVVLDDPSTYVEHTTLSDVLAAISKQAPRLSFISDCSLADLGFPATKSGKVAEILDQTATLAKERWQFDPRGYVVLRNRFVYRNRGGAVPATLWRRFAQAAQRTGGLTLRDYARLAATLTIPQLGSLLMRKNNSGVRILPLQIHTEVTYSFAGELRILAALQDHELRALERGATLPVPDLVPTSRAAVARAAEMRAAWDNRIPIEPVETMLLPQLALRLQVGPARSSPVPPTMKAYELEVLVPGQEPLFAGQFEAMPTP